MPDSVYSSPVSATFFGRGLPCRQSLMKCFCAWLVNARWSRVPTGAAHAPIAAVQHERLAEKHLLLPRPRARLLAHRSGVLAAAAATLRELGRSGGVSVPWGPWGPSGP